MVEMESSNAQWFKLGMRSRLQRRSQGMGTSSKSKSKIRKKGDDG